MDSFLFNIKSVSQKCCRMQNTKIMKMKPKGLRASELRNAVLHLFFEWMLHDCAETLQCDSTISLSFECEEEEKQGTGRGCKVNMLKSCNQSTGSHPKSCQLYQAANTIQKSLQCHLRHPLL